MQYMEIKIRKSLHTVPNCVSECIQTFCTVWNRKFVNLDPVFHKLDITDHSLLYCLMYADH